MADDYQPNHPRRYRRGPRLARFLTALAVFAATTASLHALSDHYGWRQGHWGSHYSNGYGFHGGWGEPCNDAQPSAQPGTPKQPT
jgi:hypothetical protein